MLVEVDEQEKLYFVVEIKGSIWFGDLRHNEDAKIKCGQKHFQAIAEKANPVHFIPTASVDDMLKYT